MACKAAVARIEGGNSPHRLEPLPYAVARRAAGGLLGTKDRNPLQSRHCSTKSSS